MMSKLDDIQNKHAEQYTCLFSESQYETGPLRNHPKQTQLKESQKSQQKSIHLRKRQKGHPRSARQKGERKAEKPNKKI